MNKASCSTPLCAANLEQQPAIACVAHLQKHVCGHALRHFRRQTPTGGTDGTLVQGHPRRVKNEEFHVEAPRCTCFAQRLAKLCTCFATLWTNAPEGDPMRGISWSIKECEGSRGKGRHNTAPCAQAKSPTKSPTSLYLFNYSSVPLNSLRGN